MGLLSILNSNSVTQTLRSKLMYNIILVTQMGNYSFSNQCGRNGKLLKDACEEVEMVLDELRLEGLMYFLYPQCI